MNIFILELMNHYIFFFLMATKKITPEVDKKIIAKLYEIVISIFYISLNCEVGIRKQVQWEDE